MTKKIIGWSVVAALVAGGAVLYTSVPAVKVAVNDALGSLGLGGEQEETPYWCPMHPEIVRKGAATCPV